MVHIYFAHAPAVARVKIGSSRDIDHRIRNLQVLSPVEVELVGVLPHQPADRERQLHDRFDTWRERGEWFSDAAPGLWDLIGREAVSPDRLELFPTIKAPEEPAEQRIIKALLRRRGMTYKKVARRMGVTPQAVSSIVNGHTTGATARGALAGALDAEPGELWPGDPRFSVSASTG